MTPSAPRVGIIGGGIAGIAAAYVLQQACDVTIFDKNDYLGGHTNTVVIPDGPDAGTPVDTGFIVFNRETYPLFCRFLDQLGVPSRPSDMSFSYWDRLTGLQYAGTSLDGLFAQRRNLLRPSFWGMLKDIARFNKRALADLEADRLTDDLTLAGYLEAQGLSAPFLHHYLLPMGAAIWSTPAAQMLQYPAANFVRFFRNHGLLSLGDRLQWYTVSGGSHSYVKRFLERFRGQVVLNAHIDCVRRTEQGALVRMADTAEHAFDYIVLAAHADQSLKLLEDHSPDEVRLLGAWDYAPNQAVLHTDTAVLPPRRRAWASWNYLRPHADDPQAPVTLTYHMNRLQGLQTEREYCVTLGDGAPIAPGAVIRRMLYHHPVYTPRSLAAQRELPLLNGQNRTFFCGSYFGHGFHEDAFRSGVLVGRAMGVEL